MKIDELKRKLVNIKNEGFIKTHRVHDTGIGKTLEDLLEIKENNFLGPDVGDIELKAKRASSDSMLTIATKSPNPRGVNKVLFDKYKYRDEEGEYSLHSTVVSSRVNPQGFRIDIQRDKIILVNRLNIEAYWPLSIFDNVLKAKSNMIMLVYAETMGKRKTPEEAFHYTEGYLLTDLNLSRLESAIKNDKFKIDIRIGVYRSGSNKGKFHDHGTGFRINKRDFLHIYDKIIKLI